MYKYTSPVTHLLLALLLIKSMVEGTHLINKMHFILLPEIEDIDAKHKQKDINTNLLECNKHFHP